jgi:hypothetical protein
LAEHLIGRGVVSALSREHLRRILRKGGVSLLLSDHDMPIEDISRLVGHSSTVVTERSTVTRAGPSSRKARARCS